MARDIMTRRNGGRSAWTPGRELQSLQEEINQLFDFDGWTSAPGLFDRNVAPAIDIQETNDEFIVDIDLPGVKRDEVDISIAENVLTIKGEKKGRDERTEKNLYRAESWYGNFQRTVSLPRAVDADGVKARMNDGVLQITLPKREEAKARSISVDVK